MDLSEDTYKVLEENYGTEIADYAKDTVENPDEFPKVWPDRIEGQVASVDSYINTMQDEGLHSALEEFSDDIEELERQGVYSILNAFAMETEI